MREAGLLMRRVLRGLCLRGGCYGLARERNTRTCVYTRERREYKEPESFVFFVIRFLIVESEIILGVRPSYWQGCIWKGRGGRGEQVVGERGDTPEKARQS